MHLNHFTYGLLTPALAYGLSVLGSLAGLVATARARQTVDQRHRARWLLLAAWAIGGTGIWVMHFMAMIGFSVEGVPVRYDVAITIASWITAIVVVAIGLFIVGYGRPTAGKILAAGLLTGIGVAAMHYSGMAAMRTSVGIGYDKTLVAASVGIAVVAATVALWFTVTMRRPVALAVAAAIMGVAVSGMHYTGMFAMRVVDTAAGRPVSGLLPIVLLGPIVVFVIAIVVVLLAGLLSRPSETDEGDTIRIVDGAPAPVPAPSVPPAQRSRTSASAFIRPNR